MIDFKHISTEDRENYEKLLASTGERGCEYSFANLYLWGRQTLSLCMDAALLFSQFNRRSVYPFPVVTGDVKPAIDAVIHDSKARGIPCRLTGLTAADVTTLQDLYPGRFRIHPDRDSHDYVYSVDDLAELKGKRYHKKRTHLNRFREAYPDAVCESLSAETEEKAKSMVERWYAERLEVDPGADFCMERHAIAKAFRKKEELGLEIFVLRIENEVAALAVGSHSTPDTFDIHFEKALSLYDGAYVAINNGFARYIRDKYPEVRYLNREEDMGIEGLRKAKLSYYPHHMIEKWWACLLEEGYDY